MRQVRVIKDRDENLLTGPSSVLDGWKECFDELMAEENERGGRVEEAIVMDQEVKLICKKDDIWKVTGY